MDQIMIAPKSESEIMGSFILSYFAEYFSLISSYFAEIFPCVIFSTVLILFHKCFDIIALF